MKTLATLIARSAVVFIVIFAAFLLVNNKKAAGPVVVVPAEMAPRYWISPVAEPLSSDLPPVRGEEKKEKRDPVLKETPVAKKHVVVRGETIEGLAKHYGVLPWQLRAENGMEAKDSLLRPGQSLTVPSIDWKSRAYTGRASWYGPGFHGKLRADTTVYDQHEVLIAHRTLPLGSSVRITNLHNGRTIVAKVLDRGPYAKDRDGKYLREIDLSHRAAVVLDVIQKGTALVRIEPL